MENNSDKAMRDKLKGLEFPFDPKAWEQMEAKLDERRKPKGLVWWWFGGIAACLLLVLGTYGYHQFASNVNSNKTALAINKNEETNNKIPSNLSSEPSAQNIHSPSNNLTGATIQSSPNSKKEKVANVTQPGQNPVSTQSTPAINKRTSSNNRNAAAGVKTNNGNKKGKAGNHKKNKNQSGTGNVQQTSIASLGNHVTGNSSNANEILAEGTSAEKRQKMTEPISLEPVWAYLFPNDKEDADDAMKKKEGEDVNLKKLDKKIFDYSLGISTNITATTLGRQVGAGTADAFDHSPSYMIGFTHDFTFFKRFAITNSILFSQTSFTVANYYSSKITEMAIPIGLKAYLVSKPKFRFYLSAGIINHIKLRETFTYQYNLANNYTGSTNLPATLGINSITNVYNPASELSINQSKRFYTSFYSSAGAEYIIHKHIVFFAEPLFYMALQKTGTQDKYKYNLGLNGGIRYQF